MMCKFYLIKLLKKIVSFSFCICVTHTLDYLTTFVYCLNYFFKYSFNFHMEIAHSKLIVG